RAPALQAGGHRFESCTTHTDKSLSIMNLHSGRLFLFACHNYLGTTLGQQMVLIEGLDVDCLSLC
ncbi:MAG: hypothetical protein LAT80_14900, partial [Balneolaceae bacterium]|nr:hypothetical protein [Balneolaceae bacterium]